jgi:CheY-like chemotaxis protein
MTYNTIILVDDNATTLFYNKDVIADFAPEAEVLSYDNPELFLNAFLGNPDMGEGRRLLLIDISMPEVSGFEVLEKLEEECDDLAKLDILIVTSSNLKSDLEKSGRFSNVRGYIEKPLDTSKLKRSLKMN